jgi:outer membrane lipoprotein SlyB
MRANILAAYLTMSTLLLGSAVAEVRPRSQAEIQHRREKKKTVKRVGAGAVGGAVVGALAGGGKGAAIGAAAGGGTGYAYDKYKKRKHRRRHKVR